MKRLFAIALLLSVFTSVFAQNNHVKTIELVSGRLSLSGTVEENKMDGTFTVTTEDGDVFVFRKGEIRRILDGRKVQELTHVAPEGIRSGMSYGQVKKYYKASDWSYSYDDRYKVGKLSYFFFPGWSLLGNNVRAGLGVTQYAISFTTLLEGILLTGLDSPEVGVPLLVVNVLTGVWSYYTTNKTYKIMNQYYGDLKSGNLAFQPELKIEPYLAMTPNAQFRNTVPTAGLSLKIAF